MNYLINITTALIFFLILGSFALHIMSLKDWLVYACSKAEQFFGNKTGQLKLRYVYNLAIKQFPIITKVIPFKLFSKLVDKALKTLKHMLENNKSITDIICDTVSKTGDGIIDSKEEK